MPDPAGADLSGAAAAAREARRASPSPKNWRAEAEAQERLGDYEGAQRAYLNEREALPASAVDLRRRSEADWARVRELARGQVVGEPASTHRAKFDRRWSKPPSAPPSSSRAGADSPAAAPTVDEPRIVTRWYFWVTVAAVAASAAAVAGTAIGAARDERGGSPERSAVVRSPAGGAVVLRF